MTFADAALAQALAADRNGYVTLMIVFADGGGVSNSCFEPRTVLGDAQPFLEIETAGPGGLDMAQPTFVVTTGARQTISGYGTGMTGSHRVKSPGYWTENGQNLGALSDKPERLTEYFKFVYADTGANSLRIWWDIGNTIEEDLPKFTSGYVEPGILKAAKEAGITRFFLCTNPPKRMWTAEPSAEVGLEALSEQGIVDYPNYLADIAAVLKKQFDVELYMVTIANEEIRIKISDWPRVVKNLRRALDARGLTRVKIGGVDWPNNDDWAWARLRAIQDDPEAWKVFDVVATHSYAMSVTERFYRQFIHGHDGKELWMTETESSGPTQTSVGKDLVGHMLNDLNHGAATWIYHQAGLAVSGDHGSTLVGYDPNGPDGSWIRVSPKYEYFKQITTAFPPGTQMRRIWGSTLGDAWYPGWGKPKGLATGGQRADGGWSFALLNTAEADEADAPRTFTLAVEELAGVTKLPATVQRTGEGTSTEVKPTEGPKYVPLKQTQENAVVERGTLTLTLGPNELVIIQTARP